MQTGFPQIRVINLDRSPDRLAHISSQLSALGLSFERFPGIDARADAGQIAQYDYPAKQISWMRRTLASGEIGCALSHFAVWELLETSAEDYFIVLEDDAVLDSQLLELPSIIAAAPDDWEILLFCGVGERRPVWAQNVGSRQLVRYFRPGVMALGYVVHRRLLKRRKSWRQPVRFAVDLWRFWWWRHGFVIYSVVPNLINHQTSLASDISTTDDARTTKRPISKLGYASAAFLRIGVYTLAFGRLLIAGARHAIRK